jgi:hypothetical protein
MLTPGIANANRISAVGIEKQCVDREDDGNDREESDEEHVAAELTALPEGFRNRVKVHG